MAPNLNKEQNRNTETNLFDESVLECTFQIEPYLPYEFTCEGMLQRVNTLIENQVRGVLIEGLPTSEQRRQSHQVSSHMLLCIHMNYGV